MSGFTIDELEGLMVEIQNYNCMGVAGETCDALQELIEIKKAQEKKE